MLIESAFSMSSGKHLQYDFFIKILRVRRFITPTLKNIEM